MLFRSTHAFFEAHGGKTVVLARWLPVVRTFAPFVAGISGMSIGRFQLYNVSGALLWVVVPVVLAAGLRFVKRVSGRGSAEGR